MAARLAKSGALACVAGWLCFLLLVSNIVLIVFADEEKCEKAKKIDSIVAKYDQIARNANKSKSMSTHKWTLADYKLQDQCMLLPGCGALRPYRLKFFCAGEVANHQIALVCHRSVLNPKAFPEEEQLSKEGKEPGFKAPGTKWIQNDPKNEITQNCTKLMEKCMNDSKCPMGDMAREHDGEVWHGFLVKLVDTGFEIELPFGKGGESYVIKIEIEKDADAEHEFYLNLGDAADAEQAFITLEEVNFDKVPDKNDTEAYEQYTRNRAKGIPIPMSHVQHLWALAQDILPTDFSETNNNIGFFTEVTPREISKDVCKDVKANGKSGLQYDVQRTYEYIDALFLNPYALSTNYENKNVLRPNKEQNMQDNRNVKKVNELAGQQFVEVLPGYLANTEFFVRAKVASGASFTIMLVHGFVEPDPTLGVTLMEISGAFDEKGVKTKCIVTFIENETNKTTKNCDAESNQVEKGLGIRSGKDFMLWVKIDESKVQISLNCQPLVFDWANVHYSPNQNRIFFTGDVELYLDAKKMAVENLATAKQDEGKGKRSLNVYKMPPNGLDGQIFVLLEGKFLENMEKVQITVASNATNNISTDIAIEKMKTGEGACKMLNFKFSIGYDPVSTSQPCETNLKLIIKLDKEAKQITIYSHGFDMATKPATFDTVQQNYVQVKGDIEIPIIELPGVILPTLWFRAHQAKYLKDKNKRMTRYEHIDVYLLRMGQDNNEFYVKLFCDECYENAVVSESPEGLSTSLILIFDFTEKKVYAKSYTLEQSGRDATKVNLDNKEAVFADNFLPPGTPGWIRIYVDSTKNEYQILLNGKETEPELHLKVDEGVLNVKGIKVEGQMIVLNRLHFTFVYEYKLKKTEKERKLRITGRVLPNAKLIEIFLIKDGNPSFIKYLGDDPKTKGLKKIIDSNKGKVLMHMRVDEERIKEKVACVEVEEINGLDPENFECKDKVPVLAQPGALHTLTFAIYPEKNFTIQLDDFVPKAYLNNLWDATHIVVAGDVVLEKDIEQLEEEENVGKPKEEVHEQPEE